MNKSKTSWERADFWQWIIQNSGIAKGFYNINRENLGQYRQLPEESTQWTVLAQPGQVYTLGSKILVYRMMRNVFNRLEMGVRLLLTPA